MTTDLTDLTDLTVTGSEIMLEIQSLQTAEKESDIRRSFEVIQEYLTDSTNSEEIAEILEDIYNTAFLPLRRQVIAEILGDIYNTEEKNAVLESGALIELGIQGMTVENGFLVKDGKLKENVKDILLAIEKRGFAPNILDATYEEWKGTWEYTQTESKGGTKVLQMVLENKELLIDSSIVQLQKKIIEEGKSLLSKIPVDKGKIVKGFNTERVIVAMFNGLNSKLAVENFNDIEILTMVQLYKICRDNKILGKLENIEKLLI